MFAGTFTVDLLDPSGADGKLRLGELGGDLVDATLTGNAAVRLHLASDLEHGSAAGHRRGFEFRLGLQHRRRRSRSGREFRQPADGGFKNVTVGLGSFFDDFVAPFSVKSKSHRAAAADRRCPRNEDQAALRSGREDVTLLDVAAAPRSAGDRCAYRSLRASHHFINTTWPYGDTHRSRRFFDRRGGSARGALSARGCGAAISGTRLRPARSPQAGCSALPGKERRAARRRHVVPDHRKSR